jgi:hypothetical protein
MRLHHGLFRSGVIAALASLALAALACNSILGIEEVESKCHVDSQLSSISKDANMRLTHFTHDVTLNGTKQEYTGTELQISLNADTRFRAALYDKFASHGVLQAAGEHKLLSGDTNTNSCGICLSVSTDFDTPSGRETWTYHALATGTMKLTLADDQRLTGSFKSLLLHHVTEDGVAIDDGCTVAIPQVDFDELYDDQ